jgi:murein DD-endopeptidase MepM/ murein hydrolase activator NlpD
LYYFNARWYDPELGRFITEDPVKDGINWYGYANQNPLRYIDPTGLESADAAADWYDAIDEQNEGWEETQEFASTEMKEEGFYSPSDGYHTGGDYVKKEAKENVTEGSPVFPEESGKIKYLREEDPGSGFGIYVGIERPNGKMVEIIAHLKSVDPNLKVDSFVDKTTAIGLAGKSGNSEGAHVHKELQIDMPVNAVPDNLGKGVQAGSLFVVSEYEGYKGLTAPIDTPWFMKD